MHPHMHLRGKDMTYTAIYPDGRREILLRVPKFDFGWQTDYWLAEPLALPKGSKFHVTAHFDNSAANRDNPDPTATVRWGDQTWEEMMIGFFTYTVEGKPRQPPHPRGDDALVIQNAEFRMQKCRCVRSASDSDSFTGELLALLAAREPLRIFRIELLPSWQAFRTARRPAVAPA